MRKKMLAYFLTIAMAVTLSGCGKEEAAPEETVQTEEGAVEEGIVAEGLTDEETAPENEENTDAESGEAEMPEETVDEPADWLAASGMAITPKGDFSLNCPIAVPQEDNSSLLTGKEDVAGSVEMTENIVGEHKEITVTLTLDTSASDSYYSDLDLDLSPEQIQSCKVPIHGKFFFDRYTGNAISCLGGGHSDYTGLVEGDSIGTMKLWGEGADQQIMKLLGEGADQQIAFYLWKTEMRDTFYVAEMTLYCPADYDGAVFGVFGWPQEPRETYIWRYGVGDETMTEALKKAIEIVRQQQADSFAIASNLEIELVRGKFDVQDLLGENCRLFTMTDE